MCPPQHVTLCVCRLSVVCPNFFSYTRRESNPPTLHVHNFFYFVTFEAKFLGVKCKYLRSFLFLEPEVHSQLKCILILLLAIPSKLYLEQGAASLACGHPLTPLNDDDPNDRQK